MKLTWKDSEAKYSHAEYLYLNKYKVGIVSWALSKGPNGESYEAGIYLPGVKVNRTLCHTEEDAVTWVECRVTAWMNEALKD